MDKWFFFNIHVLPLLQGMLFFWLLIFWFVFVYKMNFSKRNQDSSKRPRKNEKKGLLAGSLFYEPFLHSCLFSIVSSLSVFDKTNLLLRPASLTRLTQSWCSNVISWDGFDRHLCLKRIRYSLMQSVGVYYRAGSATFKQQDYAVQKKIWKADC